MRISARLDEKRSQKLRFLREATELGTSEVLRCAIDAYFDQLREARPAELLRRSGFVGFGEADPDLSGRVEDHLAEILNAKHDSR